MPATFNTITGDDWKRSVVSARSGPNPLQQEIINKLMPKAKDLTPEQEHLIIHADQARHSEGHHLGKAFEYLLFQTTRKPSQ